MATWLDLMIPTSVGCSMPFKKGRDLQQVNRNLDKFTRMVDQKTRRALYAAAVTGAGISKTMTPILSSNLVNSQFTQITATARGYRATTGYTANYAAAVHEKEGKLKGQPRPGGNGVYWAPAGEPKFLSKAFEGNNLREVNKVFFRGMKL